VDHIRQAGAREWLVVVALGVMAIASGHLIEDYLYGVHKELGFGHITGLLLAMAYYGIFGALIALAAQGKRTGVTGLLIMGAFLTVAEILYHGPQIILEWPYRAGVFSKGLELVVMAGSALLAVLAWRVRQEMPQEPAPDRE
jgi:hypothetical protein